MPALYIRTCHSKRERKERPAHHSIKAKAKDTSNGERNKKPKRERLEKALKRIRGFVKKKKRMQTIEQQPPQQNQLMVHNSGSLSFSSQMSKEDEEMSKSALSNFRAKEEEIEKKRMDIREKVQLQLGRVEEETKCLAMIREELEALSNPMRKEVSLVRKKIDTVNKELKPLGHTTQNKEKEYKEALEAFNENNKEKLVGESEKMRLKKLEELSKNVESMH